MSTISGLLPDGHGPSAEVVKVETENGLKSLDSLRFAISSLQSGFDDFRSKQDAFCMGYEREDANIEKQILEEDNKVGGCHRQC